MRILQVIESFGAGSMQVVLTISERLAAEGHRLAIAHGRVAESPPDARAAVAEEVELFGLPWDRTARAQVRAGLGLRAIVREWRPDVVHLHSSFAGFVGAASLPPGVPLIYTPHGYSFIRSAQPAYTRAALRLVEAAVARRVALVGVVSHEEARRAGEIRAPRVAVVPNGIAELDDPPGPRPPSSPPRVVAVGRLDPARRPEQAARIMAGLSDVAVGEWIGGGDPALAAAVRAQGVQVTGWLPRAAALDRLAEAAACLHWSAWDAQPISVLEAMARDVVVVASDIPANRELLGDAQVCSTEAQAAALLRTVLSDPDRRAALRDEQRRRRGRYGAARMAGDWSAVYRRVARAGVGG